MNIFVLTFEYFDKSGFHVCGVTQTYAVAVAWMRAGNGQHKVYSLVLDQIADHATGHEAWKEVLR